MTWSYSGDPATANKDAVRFLIYDTLQGDPLIQDEEILYALSVRFTVWGAAAQCCRSLAAKFSRDADVAQGSQRVAYSARSRSYMMRAQEYEQRDLINGAATPYAGGISISDKIEQEQNADRKQPEFNLGMDDNALPIGAGGNQLETSEDAAS